MSHFKQPGFPQPPVAPPREIRVTTHDQLRIDNYDWLRATNWQEVMQDPDALDSEIRTYLDIENLYAENLLADTTGLQNLLIAELRGRIKENDHDVPEIDGPYAYFWRYDSGGEYPYLGRLPVVPGTSTLELLQPDLLKTQQILLHGVSESSNHEYFELGDFEVSPDHQWLAWSVDVQGAEYYELRIRNLVDGHDLPYRIKDVDSVTWINSETLLYTCIDESHRSSSVFRHSVFDDPETDVCLMTESDPSFELYVGRLRSGAYVEIVASADEQDEVWVINTKLPMSKPELIEPRTPGLEYSLDHQGECFVIVTNADGATDFKIVKAPVDSPGRHNWDDLVLHKPGHLIHGAEVTQDWIVWTTIRNALPVISIQSKKGVLTELKFEEEAYELQVDLSNEYHSHSIRFYYQSPTTPMQTWEYDLASGRKVLLKSTEIPSGHNPSSYVTHRILATSKDGVQVPITCLARADIELDGSAPCVLEGYGSYGSSMPADFSNYRFSLVDRGFVYAIAHIRGGQEMGRAWYEDAKGVHKQNSFNDYIACAEMLISAGYTTQDRMIAMGRSAGGLLVGAVLNQAPDLFAGAIADVPFVDVLATMLDESLPLTPSEWTQWGNPIDSAEAYKTIAAYSPYDNVQVQRYPSLLVTAGLTDPRVFYWEAARWVARLRELKTDDNALLFHTHIGAGHFGASGRFETLDEDAREIAFMLKVVGQADCVV